MENQSQSKSIILGFSIFFGLSLLGFCIFKGLQTFSDKDRAVTVKGLAEMNMMAQSATIDLSFSFSSDDIQAIIKSTEQKRDAVVAYLSSAGYSLKDLKINKMVVTDRQRYYESRWEGERQVEVKIDRYIVVQNVTLQSKDVKNLEEKIAQMKLDLVSKDLTCSVNIAYSFPELNSIKPKLIAESTKNARVAGEQFANDSQAKLGKIKTASQGQITIVGNYYYDEVNEAIEKPKEPYFQKARVVSTIVFFLE